MPEQLANPTTTADSEGALITVVLLRPTRPIEVTEVDGDTVTITWPTDGDPGMEPDIDFVDLKAGRTMYVQLTGPRPASNVTQIAVGNNIVQSAGGSSVVVVDGQRVGPQPIRISAPKRAKISYRYGDPSVTITGNFLREDLV